MCDIFNHLHSHHYTCFSSEDDAGGLHLWCSPSPNCNSHLSHEFSIQNSSMPAFLSCKDIFLYLIIINIIMSCRQHGYPWPSLATPPYRSSPLPGLQGYIPFPHRNAVCMFELAVLLLLSHMWGSIGVHHLWARPSFSSSVLLVWFV